MKNTKKPNKSSPAAARKILRGPLFWIIAALIAVSIFGQISATGEEFKKVETSVILNEIFKPALLRFKSRFKVRPIVNQKCYIILCNCFIITYQV